MGFVLPELSLDVRPTFVPKTISDFLKGVSMIENVPERMSKVDDFAKILEDEMRKIDAFKRELPLCMFLLNDAISILNEEKVKCEKPIDKPVLEEFIPVKKDSDANGGLNINEKENDYRDKKTWMSSVQLWKTDDYPISDFSYNPKQNSKMETKRNEKEHDLLTEDPFRSSRKRTGGMTFMPFESHPAFPPTTVRKEDKDKFTTHVLSLLTPGLKNPKEESGCFSALNAQSNSRTGLQPPRHQTSRKQRRCWSQELHRRFVNALQQLGGSQVATPKQIRDIMQVDGLTNDEVKSHLQKYRLHTRRFHAGTAGAVNQSVLLEGLWMSDDSWKGDGSQLGSPEGPLHLACGGGGTSTTGGDSLEDDEDAPSESYS